MEVDKFKRTTTHKSVVSLGNLQKELADLATYLFKDNETEVDAWWHELEGETMHWTYLLFPAGFDTDKIPPDYRNPNQKRSMNVIQMEVLELKRSMVELLSELQDQDKAKRDEVYSILKIKVEKLKKLEEK
ncbi:hypothetical protein FLAG1_01150 [Fusarium langsethiae]|uniref:Uncharacterized protein n=1 Tax=Fusarium langsethiae TaxID=179993 RepID=A0A0M9F4I7_FUSLA|nr:hypothetical protein FLAG1_01150 [Fusarium langsethiae]GKU17431.1 unnamed protein product [Fusarium langsethiae]